jgi:hypothetical protein
MTDKLDELLTSEEPEEKPADESAFKPQINVREEFALWVRKQFPELQLYSKKRRVYQELETRKDEVYEAALGAVNHGVLSTEACATARLRNGWQKFEEGFGSTGTPKKRAKSLDAFVKSLEALSISLGGDKHYTECGKNLNGVSYGQGGYSGGYVYQEFDAFIYRLGPEDGKETQYQVFDKKQEIQQSQDGQPTPALIGEFTGLSKWNFEHLQKTAAEFKGSEDDFIKKVDIQVPQSGSYSYQSTYSSENDSGSYYGGYGKRSETIISSRTPKRILAQTSKHIESPKPTASEITQNYVDSIQKYNSWTSMPTPVPTLPTTPKSTSQMSQDNLKLQ